MWDCAKPCCKVLRFAMVEFVRVVPWQQVMCDARSGWGELGKAWCVGWRGESRRTEVVIGKGWAKEIAQIRVVGRLEGGPPSG